MKKFVIGLIIGLSIGLASTAVANNTTVQATFQKFNIVVDGQLKNLSTDPIVYNGTTYLPVRAVSEMLGYGVSYQEQDRTIILSYKGTPSNPVGTGEYISFSDLKSQGVHIIEMNNGNSIRFVNNGRFVEIRKPTETGTYRAMYSVEVDLHIKVEDGEIFVRKEELFLAGIINSR